MKRGAECSVDGCHDPVLARGWCIKHYNRWRAHGDPLLVFPKSRDAAIVMERFMAKVDKNGPIPASHPELGPCWLWTANTTGGYGKFSVGGRPRLAHRWLYEQIRGPIPAGLEPDHLCRVRRCVCVDHMEIITKRQNILRGEGWGAKNARKTHCPHGHAYEGANVMINSKGSRVCRECRNGRRRKQKPA